MNNQYQHQCILKINVLCCITILFLSTSFNSLKATELTNEADKMYVHLDKGFYVTGERVYFTIFQSNKFLNQSIQLKISLSDAAQKIIHSQFISSEGTLRQSGQIDIPYQLASNYYNLVIQVFDTPTKSILNLAEISIPIYSDFEPLPTTEQSTRKTSILKKEQLNISLKTRNPNVAKRSKVEPVIQIKDKKGRFVKADISMSVSDVMTNAGFDNLFMFKVPYDCTYLGNQAFFEGVLNQRKSLKETDYKTLLPQHRATSFTKTNCSDQTVMLIDIDKLNIFDNLNQSFILYDSLIFSPSNVIQSTHSIVPTLIYNDVIISYIKASRIRRKINLYYQFLPNSSVMIADKPFFTPQLFWKSGEYTRFKTTAPNFYFQSDDRSAFQIDLVARDESGNIGRKKIIYSVY